MMRKLRFSFSLIAVAASIVAAAVIFTAVGSAQAPTTPRKKTAGGHLYMQTNEVKNAIIHYRRFANGTLTEVERVATGGAGSGELSPIYHTNRPNDFEGAASVILTPDRRFLFATNAGDNSVSSFAVNKEGRLTLLDVERTGNTQGGGAKSVAYDPSSRTLFVVHTFGPDHLRLMSVDSEGKLTPRPERYSVNTMDWPNRVPTMAVLSPDGKFLFVGTAFDEYSPWAKTAHSANPHFTTPEALLHSTSPSCTTALIHSSSDMPLAMEYPSARSTLTAKSPSAHP
jgi:hypothetical protein